MTRAVAVAYRMYASLLALALIAPYVISLIKYPKTKVLEVKAAHFFHPFRTRTHAVIHMGVHKTGSTTIQALSAELIASLGRDGFEMPWSSASFSKSRSLLKIAGFNQVHFSTCFLKPSEGERKVYPCVPELLLAGLEIAQRNKSLFISAETFDGIDDDGLKLMTAYLSSWDHTSVIVFYRRYYDWLISVHGQISNANPSFADLSSFISDQIRSSQFSHTTNLVKRLKGHALDVVVLNFHEGEHGLPEKFYCDAIPEIWQHTCQALRTNYSMTALKQNTAKDNTYEKIVKGAIDAGLVQLDPRNGLKFKAMCNSVKDYHEQTHSAKEDLLIKKCPPSDDLQLLLNISIELELDILPHLSQRPSKQPIEEDFSRRVASGGFCGLNVDETLKLLEWKSYFESTAVQNSTT